MKNEIRLALLCLAVTSAPAFAQGMVPQCGPAMFDQARNAYTVMNPSASTVNQQCLLTVRAPGTMSNEERQSPSTYVAEGTYMIELSGGGGGGGGGANRDKGGGGGGAGAAPSKTSQYLSPGVYKLTIGTGGYGGDAKGGRTGSGNPTSMTVASSGQLIAGFAGADTWQQQSVAATDGRGGQATPGGSTGGNGGDSGPRSEENAQSGGQSQTGGYAGQPGRAGTESGRGVDTTGTSITQANAGGGGGASVGSGGSGESANRNSAAGQGDLGGGGGGGRGGQNMADRGAAGGHGFIRLTMTQAATVAMAPAPAPIVMAAAPVARPAPEKYSLSTDALFGFGKSTLKPAGEAKLDELVGKLRGINIQSITDTGHADRFGSEELNQRLSEERAMTVKNYLVGKGIDSNLIASSGKGESQPMTAAGDCKGPATAKVIACLAPDRRVDLEVFGTR